MKTTDDQATGILGRLARSKQAVVEALRAAEGPLTYDRIGARLGYSSENIRNVSGLCGQLRDAGIIEEAARTRTITGAKASAFALKAPFDEAPMPWMQDALFNVHAHASTTKQRVMEMIASIGTKQAEPRDVSIEIIDMLTGVQMPEDCSFDIDEEPVTLPYRVGSETSHEAAKRAKAFDSDARRRAYGGIVQGWRATGRGLTRNELGRETGMWMSTLLPRVHELINAYEYVEEGAPFAHPLSGHQQQPLRPRGRVALVTVGVSSFYNDRIDMAARLEALLTTGMYLGDAERVHETTRRWTEEFVKKHGKPNER